MLTIIAISIIVLLACSATTSATETAITAASPSNIAARARAGEPAAKRLDVLLANREDTIGALLLANNIFNILGAALATDLFLKLVGEAGVALATLVMTVLVVIFAEVLPKTYAIRDPESFALRMSWPATGLVQAARPVSFVLSRIVWAALRLLRADASTIASVSSADQLRATLASLQGDKVLGDQRRKMLQGVLDLDRAKIDAAMTHRSRMATLDADLKLADVTGKLQESPYSRIPLWREREENIVGFLHVRDLIGVSPHTKLSEVMHRAWFVPDTTSLQKQLEAFSERRAHMAIVVDEYGDLQGLVTLEDILEEIVGDIHDERDRLSKPIARDTLGNATVPGHLSLNEVNRLMEWDLPVESAATLAGLVVEAEQRIVEVGETINVGNHRIEVLDQRRGMPTELRLHADAA